MNPFDLVARLLTVAASCSLDEQWRFAVLSMAAFCVFGV